MALRPRPKLRNKNKYNTASSYSFKKRNDKPIIFPLQPSNKSRKKTKTSTRFKRRSFNFNINNAKPFLVVILAIVAILLVSYFAFSRQALAVMVNNEPVGYIRDMETTEDEINSLILAKLKEDVGNNIELNEKVTLKKVNSIFKNVSNNAEGVVANACKAVTYKQEATKIVVDGKQACIVSNESIAKEVLKKILDSYTPPNGTTDPEFAADVKTESTFVNSTDVADLDTAVKLLSQTKQEERTYTVVSGDTFASIAANAGMTEADLLKANPSITSETKSNLSVGQKLKIVMTVPTITIRTYKVETKKETIPYETKREYDDSMSSGDTEEVQEGVNGEKEVYQKVAYVNGVAQGSATTSEKVTKEPVTRIIKIGTYEPDYSSDDSSDDDDYSDDSDYSDSEE